MIIQCTRYLKKLYKKYKEGQNTDIEVLSYINNLKQNVTKVCQAKSVQEMCTVSQVLEAMEVNASYVLMKTFDKIMDSSQSKKVLENDVYALDLLKVGFAHLYAVTLKIYRDHSKAPKCKSLKGHMDNLCALYGLCNLKSDLSGLYECGYFQPGATDLIDKGIKHMLSKLRPQILNLIEVFPFTDNVLMSAVGNSYGDIYETHLEWAQTSRLNDDRGSIPEGYMKYVMPILQGKL